MESIREMQPIFILKSHPLMLIAIHTSTACRKRTYDPKHFAVNPWPVERRVERICSSRRANRRHSSQWCIERPFRIYQQSSHDDRMAIRIYPTKPQINVDFFLRSADQK